jgi:hypothetical protein
MRAASCERPFKSEDPLPDFVERVHGLLLCTSFFVQLLIFSLDRRRNMMRIDFFFLPSSFVQLVLCRVTRRVQAKSSRCVPESKQVDPFIAIRDQ